MPDVGAALERLLAGQQTVIDRLGRIEERMAQLERRVLREDGPAVKGDTATLAGEIAGIAAAAADAAADPGIAALVVACGGQQNSAMVRTEGRSGTSAGCALKFSKKQCPAQHAGGRRPTSIHTRGTCGR